MESLGKRVKRLRIAAKMTQEDVASALKLRGIKADRGTVARWETDVQMPTVSPCRELAHVFGVTLDYIVEGIEPYKMSCTGKEQEVIESIRKQPRLIFIYEIVKDFADSEISLAIRLLGSIKNNDNGFNQAK